jgi:hypothetical protein
MTYSVSLSKLGFPRVNEVAVLVVAGLLALALLVGSRQRTKSEGGETISNEFGPFPAVLLFTSAACENCEPARKLVFAEAPEIAKEVVFDLQPGLFELVRLNGVPTTIIVDSTGLILSRIEGVPAEGSVAGLRGDLE